MPPPSFAQNHGSFQSWCSSWRFLSDTVFYYSRIPRWAYTDHCCCARRASCTISSDPSKIFGQQGTGTSLHWKTQRDVWSKYCANSGAFSIWVRWSNERKCLFSQPTEEAATSELDSYTDAIHPQSPVAVQFAGWLNLLSSGATLSHRVWEAVMQSQMFASPASSGCQRQ